MAVKKHRTNHSNNGFDAKQIVGQSVAQNLMTCGARGELNNLWSILWEPASSLWSEMEISGSLMLLSANLDLRPLHFILWKDLHFEGAVRPLEYSLYCTLRVLLLSQLEQIPYVKDSVKRLKRYKEIRLPCGYRENADWSALPGWRNAQATNIFLSLNSMSSCGKLSSHFS